MSSADADPGRRGAARLEPARPGEIQLGQALPNGSRRRSGAETRSGVARGDRVVAYMPTSRGRHPFSSAARQHRRPFWSSAATEFGALASSTASQIEPKY